MHKYFQLKRLIIFSYSKKRRKSKKKLKKKLFKKN